MKQTFADYLETTLYRRAGLGLPLLGTLGFLRSRSALQAALSQTIIMVSKTWLPVSSNKHPSCLSH